AQMYPAFVPGRTAPKGARFYSPGRSHAAADVALGADQNLQEGPTGRDSSGATAAQSESRPVGAARTLWPPTQGFASLRPGLSNLAPFGALSLQPKNRRQAPIAPRPNGTRQSSRSKRATHRNSGEFRYARPGPLSAAGTLELAPTAYPGLP